MKILVTGSQGRIGRWVVKYLSDAGYSIRAVDREMDKQPGAVETTAGDIRNLEFVRQATKGMDAVIHLAALLADPPGSEEADFQQIFKAPGTP